MSDVDTLTLAEFVLARIAEDEAVARVAGEPEMEWYEPRRRDVPSGETRHSASVVFLVRNEYPDGPSVAFMKRFDPARVLAECEAKRKIIDLHKPVNFTNVDIWVKDRTVCCTCHCTLDMPDEWPEEEKDWPYPVVQWSWPCPTMLALAEPYADHPDFREHWDEHAAEQSSAATRLHVSTPFRDHLPPRPAAH